MASLVDTCSGVKDVSGVSDRTMDFVASPTGDDHKLGNRSSGAANQNRTSWSADQLEHRCSEARLSASAPQKPESNLYLLSPATAVEELLPGQPEGHPGQHPTHDQGPEAPGQSKLIRYSTARKEWPGKGQHNKPGTTSAASYCNY